MNVTGDPNPRNKPSMFGFNTSFLNPPLNLPQVNERIVTLNSPGITRTTSITNSIPPAMNNSPHFDMANYAFPSTSSVDINPSAEAVMFPFPQTTPGRRIGPDMQRANASLGSHFNWYPSDNLLYHPEFGKMPSSNRTALKPASISFGCKRKTDSPPLPPLKQHITEERMAEQMSRLHISSQTPTSSRESEPIRERRLFMCEEMQRLQNESIIPAQILERVNRPCTALVPWRPPLVPSVSKENNNNEDEADNNVMVEETTSDSINTDMMES